MSTPQNELTQQLQSTLDADTAELTNLAQENKPEPFTEKPPERDTGIYNRMPYLIGLVALGGKFSKLHGKTMLSATNGMVQGLMKGDQAAYQEQQKKYDDAYQRWLDKFTVQQRLFAEMRQVYKGRIDADLKALEFARKATMDDHKVTQDDVKNHLQAEQMGIKLKEVNEKIRHNEAAEATARDRETRLTEKDTASKGAKGTSRAHALTLVDELEAIVEQNKSVTGLGGKARRIGESVAGMFGIDVDTAGHRFESKLSELQLLLPKLLTGSSKSAKDERERVDKVARGLKLGDDPKSTVDALKELKKSIEAISGDQPAGDKFETGKVYVDQKTGARAKYLGNGKWEPQPKT